MFRAWALFARAQRNQRIVLKTLITRGGREGSKRIVFTAWKNFTKTARRQRQAEALHNLQ